MKKRYLILFVIVALLVGACGGEAPPQPAATQPPQPAATAPQSPAPPTAPAGGPEAPADIPLMPDAANVTSATTAEGAAITYSSASALDAVVTFYQSQMPAQGWGQGADATVVSGVSAVLHYTKGARTATITATSTGSGTSVVIALPEATAGPPPAPPTAPAGGPEAPADIPLMPDAANVTSATTAEGTSITYQSASPFDSIVTFYQTEMPARGWTYQGEVSTVVSGVSAVLYFVREGQEATVTLTNVGLATTVVIAVTGEATAGPPPARPTSPPAQPTSPPAQPTSPPAQPTSPPAPTAEPTAAGPCERGSGQNFSGQGLMQPNFQGQDLRCANFAATELFQPNFSNANLFRVMFDDAEIHEGNFSGANLSEARFDFGEYAGPNFSGANLTRATFVNVEMTDPNFTNADLTGADLTTVEMTGAIWNNTICPDGQNSNNVGGSCQGHY